MSLQLTLKFINNRDFELEFADLVAFVGLVFATMVMAGGIGMLINIPSVVIVFGGDGKVVASKSFKLVFVCVLTTYI